MPAPSFSVFTFASTWVPPNGTTALARTFSLPALVNSTVPPALLFAPTVTGMVSFEPNFALATSPTVMLDGTAG